jgi:hypothetical protein|tara:strand:+ start:14014 stop:14901 length:888 start_codon:yes stop_codon:yes gene_type:complete
MKNCYIDLPTMELPWTVDDIFSDEDYELINDNKSHLKPFIIKTNKLAWNNWQSQPANEYDKYIHSLNGREDDNIHFNGTALIKNSKLKREVYDWARDTFHEDYLDDLWELPGGKLPPITILCFNKTSKWHTEGPVKIPNDIPVDFNTQILHQVRASVCCNFRLLGDVDESILQFTHATDELNNKYNEVESKFVNTWLNNNPDYKITPQGLPEVLAQDGLKVSASTSYIADSEMWRDHIPISAERKGMHNPFFINLAKWHRVLTNNTPRVSFRVHSGEGMNFRRIEELVSSGNFFK